MKFDTLTAKDLQFCERPRLPIRNKAEQVKIIRYVYLKGTDAEKKKMDSLLGRTDVQLEVKDLIQTTRSSIEGYRRSFSVARIPFQIPEPSEAV